MKVVFTARRIKPGHFDQFRQAWEPEGWPEGMVKAYILRDPGDPDVIIAFGLFDVSDQRAGELAGELEPSEKARHDRMAAHVDETIASGLFDVVHTESGTPTGDKVIVPLTERRLKPGTFAQYRAAAQATFEQIGTLAPGLARVMVLQNTSDADHLIQFGIVRTNDPEGMRAASGPGREGMLNAIEPFVDSVGLDATYELVEELSPVHA